MEERKEGGTAVVMTAVVVMLAAVRAESEGVSAEAALAVAVTVH